MPAWEHLEKVGLPGNSNAQLAYSSADGSFSLWTRVRKLSHRWEAIYTESHAREYRAMYPHQRAVGQFALTFECNGYREYELLMNFFRSYVATIGEQFDNQISTRPTMHVATAVRNFSRSAIPISGMNLGDHVGSMVFTPTVVFESAHDPLDPTILTGNQASTTDLAGTETDAKNFFYPFSRASYDTSVKPESVYDFNPNDNTAANGLGKVVTGAAQNTKDTVESILDALGRANG
jgi:hypothetical protein